MDNKINYRKIAKSGAEISELSFGCGHLPEDDNLARETIKTAIKVGCNYFETATFYCNNRCQQKTALGISGERDGLVSVKAGVPPEVSAKEYRESIMTQLEVLGVKSTTWLQVGWLSLENFEILQKNGDVLNEIYKMRDEGIFKHLGFTGHDTPENFIKIIESGVFECVTLPYHMLNRSYEPTIKAAGEAGMGVVAMNPVGGGLLGNISDKLNSTIPSTAVTSTAELALRFVLTNPNITSACSGMNSPQMVLENVVAANKGPLTADEYEKMLSVLDTYKALGEKFCTGCRYCADCPQGIDIAGLFNLYNLHTVYGFTDAAKASYERIDSEKSPTKCVKCGLCEERCPNKIDIMNQIEKTIEIFS